MFYSLTSGLHEQSKETIPADELVYGCIREEELQAKIKSYGFSLVTLEEYRQPKRMIHKMDSHYGYNFGVFHALNYTQQHFETTKIGMYITKNMVLIVCDDVAMQTKLYDAVAKMNDQTYCLEHVVSAILNGILTDNVEMIEEIENELAFIEEEILENKTENFNQRTRTLRNDIFYLAHYYEQLIDACEELLQDENSFFMNSEIHHIRILTDRINRLSDHVVMLKEYLVQIRESCRSQMDANLNHIMYIFTVVTTIFLPLTLIVGWYGMNFKNMPELTWQYGYVSVVILSIVIVVICIWFFRKKKLLK